MLYVLALVLKLSLNKIQGYNKNSKPSQKKKKEKNERTFL